MKIYKLAIPLFLAFILSITNARAQNFNKLEQSTDSSYGYSINKPLKLGNGDPVASVGSTRKFIKGLKTSDGQNLQLLDRSSLPDPNYKEPPGGILASLGDGGVLDRYTFVTSVKKDTVALYVDIYHGEKLKVPVGLIYSKP